MQTTKLDDSVTCPECKAVLDAATEKKQPLPGSLSICAYCALPLVFTDTLDVRAMLESEFDVLPVDTRSQMTAIRLAILRAKAKRDVQH